MGEAGAWSYIILAFIATIGLLFSIVLFFSTDKLPSKCLASVIFCFSVIGVNYALLTTNFFLKYPEFWRFPIPFSFLLPVFSYKYVLSTVRQQYRFSWWDLLFLIPVILYIFNFIEFFGLPLEEKVSYISKMLENKQLVTKEMEGLLPPTWGVKMRLLYGIGFVVAQIFVIYKYKKRLSVSDELYLHNLQVYRWLFFFTSVLLLSYVMIFTLSLIQLKTTFDTFIPATITIGGSIAFICIYLLLKPKILFGLVGWEKIKLADVVKENKPTASQTKLTNQDGLVFTLGQRLEYKSLIEVHLRQNSPFTKSGYKIKDLSKELDLPVYVLSSFINQEYAKNFNEFINDFRIEYISDKLKSSPDTANFTLAVIAKSAGFNSRTSFISAVKRKTGVTPSVYFFGVETKSP
jgi:AraC-like DNA-binding protein